MLDGLNTRGLIRLDELSVSKHKNGHSLLSNTAKKHAMTSRIGAQICACVVNDKMAPKKFTKQFLVTL